MIAFLDSSAIVYLIEGERRLATRTHAQLDALRAGDPAVRVAISSLARLECRVGPMKAGDASTLATYDAFFGRPDLIEVEPSAQVIDLAAAIRARDGLNTPDALHAACCLQVGSEHAFLTGDATFQRVTGLNVRLLR